MKRFWVAPALAVALICALVGQVPLVGPAAAQTSGTLAVDASLGIERLGAGWLAGSSNGGDSYSVTRVNSAGTPTWSYDLTTSNGGAWVLETFGALSYVAVPDEPGTGTPATLTSLNFVGGERFTAQVSSDGAVLEMAATSAGVAYAETTGTIDQVLGFVSATGDLVWTRPFPGFRNLRKIEAEGSLVYALGDDFIRSFDIDTGQPGFLRTSNSGASQLLLTSSSIATISDEGPGGDFEIRFRDKSTGAVTGETTVPAPSDTRFIGDSYYEPSTGRIVILSDSGSGPSRSRHLTVIDEDGAFLGSVQTGGNSGARFVVANADTIVVAGNPAETFDMTDFDPAPPADPCDGQSLVECYAPEFRFHPDEAFFPMDPNEFVEGSQLFFSNTGSLCDDELVDPDPNVFTIANDVYTAAAQDVQLSFLPPFFNCEVVGEDVSVQVDFTRPFSDNSASFASDRPPTLSTLNGFYLRASGGTDLSGNTPVGTVLTAPIFARVLPAEDVDGLATGLTAISYQVFYGNDPKARASFGQDDLNDVLDGLPFDVDRGAVLSLIDGLIAHEGDWERIDVILDANNDPQEVRYFGHGCTGATYRGTHWVDWEDLDDDNGLVDGTHPVVYVAEGSHAAYPFERGTGQGSCPEADPARGLTDITEFTPQSVVWQPWQTPELILDPTVECWHGFNGAWGNLGTGRGALEVFAQTQSPATWESLFGILTHGTGPAGPFHNMALAPDAPIPTDCLITRRAGQPDVEKTWDEPASITMEGLEPGTVVLLTLASVEVPLAIATADAAGVAVLSAAIPAGTSPGAHQLIVRDAQTGDRLSVTQINVTVPSECLTTSTSDADIDSDYVLDSCDPNPADGPLGDADNDLVINAEDNCPLTPNRDQAAAADWSQGTACDESTGINPVAFIVDPATYPQAPTANDDQASVEVGETITVNVLANDTASDAAIDPTSLETTATAGVTAIVNNGELEVTGLQSRTGSVDYLICDTTGRCDEATLTIDVQEPPPSICNTVVVDSFQQGPWVFTFQIRNTTSAPVDFVFTIPNTNYRVDGLVFNGSGQNLTLVHTPNGAGFDITISGTIPAWQSVGGQQPNGFNGQLTPTSEPPELNCT